MFSSLGSATRPRLFGRAEECRRVAGFGVSGSGALVVTGEAGIGRSALLADAVGVARAAGVTTLLSYPAESTAPREWSVLTDLLDEVDLHDADLGDAQLEAVETAVRRRVAGVGAVDRTAVEVGTWHILRRLTEQAPLLVVIDDVQWADPSSLDALVHAVRRLPSSACRLLLARRTGSEPSALEEEMLKRSLELLECGPLGPPALAQLLEARLGVRFPAWVLDKLARQSRGNPLLALEFAVVLNARGLPAYGAPLDLAEDHSAELTRRVATQPDPIREVLLVLALEPGLDEAELVELTGSSAVADALARDLLRRRPDGRLGPSSTRVAAVARHLSMNADIRAQHRRIGAVLHGHARARHLALGSPGVGEETAALLELAARDALHRGDAEAATELAGLALERSPHTAARHARRVLLLGECLAAVGDVGQLTRLLREERAGLDPGDDRARAALLLREGDVDTVDGVLALVDEVLAEPAVDPHIRAEALSLRAQNLAASSVEDLDLAVRLGLEAVALDPSQAGGLAWASAVHGVDHETSPPAMVPVRHSWRGDVALARRRLTEEAEEAGLAGSSWGRYDAARLLVEVELRAGSVTAAEAAMTRWLVTSEDESRASPDVPRARARLAALRGDAAEAARLAADVVEVAAHGGFGWAMLDGHTTAGLAATCAGDSTAAAERYGWVWRRCREQGVDNPGVFPVAWDLVDALIRERRVVEAEQVRDRLQGLAHEQDHPWALAAADQASGLLSLVEGSAAGFDLVRRAVACFDDLGLVHDAARALCAAGSAARRQRRWGNSRALLAEAGERFTAIGATGWADPAGAELARLGGRRTASHVLTPSQATTARLAAEGRSNREIARATGIAVRTVEDHLSHAYAKLGVRSRTQLAAALRRTSTDGVENHD